MDAETPEGEQRTLRAHAGIDDRRVRFRLEADRRLTVAVRFHGYRVQDSQRVFNSRFGPPNVISPAATVRS